MKMNIHLRRAFPLNSASIFVPPMNVPPARRRKVFLITTGVCLIAVGLGAFPFLLHIQQRNNKRGENRTDRIPPPQARIRGAYLNTGSRDVGPVEKYKEIVGEV